MVDILSSQVGKENIDASPFVSIAVVLEFLDTHLPNFPNAFKQMPSSTKDDNEDDITQDLANYLQDLTYPNGVFMFQFQRKPRKSRRSSDIGVTPRGLLTFQEFFVIEAKRLPLDRKNREKEYVKGNLGGIERYKREHHGKGLPESAMVGYVQKETCSHWHSKINDWIEELISNKEKDIIWDKFDLLKHLSDFGKVQKYVSENRREKDSIKLHHYLMDLK